MSYCKLDSVASTLPFDFHGTQRFELLRCLGAGGMGVVYEALDRETNSCVALKTLRRMDANALLRFKNEFRTLAHLAHPNLVSLGELFEDDGRLSFTMELIRGVDFLSHVRVGSELSPPPLPSPLFADKTGERDGSFTASVHDTVPDLSPEALLGMDATEDEGRAPALFDESRLRAATVQLARAVAALHRAGKVHRDIKPSNVMVASDGRVVLLDFGLVADVGRDRISDGKRLIGTVRYMAPEQAKSSEVGAPADWYSVGVVLYTALTGSAPFSGSVQAVLRAKARRDPPPPAARAEGVPGDLSELCSELLRRDPHARPAGEEILSRLGADLDGVPQLIMPAHGSDDWRIPTPSGSSPLPTRGDSGRIQSAALPVSGHDPRLFVGRQAELVALRGGLHCARTGEPAVFLVHGESGVGKTALVRHFAARASTRGDALVLYGRCYQRESVAYKAVDELIDELAGYLSALPVRQVEKLLPRRSALLTQMFPVLRRISPLQDADIRADGPLAVREHRALAFAALRELLDNIARQRPLILVIDDLQWSDLDSLALLSELVRQPGAPGLLLIATVRTADAGVGTLGRSALRSAFPGAARELEITQLPDRDARRLVAQLAAGGDGAVTDGAVDVEAIVAEAGGHPLFIDVLVRHLAAVGHVPEALHLDEALWWHVRRVETRARDLLAIVCVAGRPLRRDLLASAVSDDAAGTAAPGELSRLLTALVSARMITRIGNPPSDKIDVFHDRVRIAVLAQQSNADTQRWHRGLARALERHDSTDPELLAVHWHGAGDDLRAADYYLEAAHCAGTSLAFDRAARLYQRCLELYPPERRSLELRVTLADSLSYAGQGHKAAREYLAAAATAEPTTALDLERRAAEQLLRCGHLEEGLAVLSRVLAAVGLEMPRS
ncbi:MAG: protein kinase, partial [Myxococcota bacterium]